jgi:hemerythrin-like domain-containing protein
MDAQSLVRENHRRLEGLLERLERAGGAAAGDGDDRLEQFRTAVAHHLDQEEGVLYPIYRERARRAEVDLAPLDRAVEQHRMIDRLARELGDADTDRAGFEAKLRVLAEQLRGHLDAEDSVLLTAIEDLIDDDTLLELGERMQRRDRLIAARRQRAIVATPARRRLAAALGGLLAAGAALLAVLARRRRPPEA